jgi:hypothetical protein
MLKRITIENYVPTLNKEVFADLEVTYLQEISGYLPEEITIDEVYCNGGNITELLTQTCMTDLAKEVAARLMKFASDARLEAYNCGR